MVRIVQLKINLDFVLFRAKLRAVKLQSYWKRICEDEKKSKQRNAQILRSMDRMEANMASLDARREKLKHMKVSKILCMSFCCGIIDCYLVSSFSIIFLHAL